MSTAMRSRREMLATALGAAGAATAAAIAAPAVALAANGDALKIGEENTGTSYTKLTNTTVGVEEAGLVGHAAGVGLLGESVDGQGVIGRSTHGAGVQGISETDAGLNGFGGPYGLWADGTSVGAHCRSWEGIGVSGEATSGVGVYATATTGAALQVVGKAKFDRANRVLMKKNTSSYKKTLAGVTASSQVFAVLRSYRAGTYVAAVVCGAGFFTIRLNKALSADTWVSYFVVN
jgi:hypothetical protein